MTLKNKYMENDIPESFWNEIDALGKEYKDPLNIPDGECDWVVGSKTFTRQEVFKILYTQRAMIVNDLKKYYWDSLPGTVKEVLIDPRKPVL